MLTFALGAGEEEVAGVELSRKAEEGKKKSVVVKKDIKETRGRKELADEGKVRGRKGSWHSHIKPPSRAQEVAIGGESRNFLVLALNRATDMVGAKAISWRAFYPFPESICGFLSESSRTDAPLSLHLF